MILRIDHIAIAVRDFDKARSFFTTLFGAIPGTSAPDESMKYFWENYCLGDLSRLELLTPTGEGSFLDGFLSSKEGGVHHITLQTNDILKARTTLDEAGIPWFGFNDYGDFWKELFIHPNDAFGVLIQIAEFNADDWLAPDVKMESGKKWDIRKTDSGCALTFPHPGGGCVTVDVNRNDLDELISELEKMK